MHYCIVKFKLAGAIKGCDEESFWPLQYFKKSKN